MLQTLPTLQEPRGIKADHTDIIYSCIAIAVDLQQNLELTFNGTPHETIEDFINLATVVEFCSGLTGEVSKRLQGILTPKGGHYFLERDGVKQPLDYVLKKELTSNLRVQRVFDTETGKPKLWVMLYNNNDFLPYKVDGL